jgi:hypothetical protein
MLSRTHQNFGVDLEVSCAVPRKRACVYMRHLTGGVMCAQLSIRSVPLSVVDAELRAARDDCEPPPAGSLASMVTATAAE